MRPVLEHEQQDEPDDDEHAQHRGQVGARDVQALSPLRDDVAQVAEGRLKNSVCAAPAGLTLRYSANMPSSAAVACALGSPSFIVCHSWLATAWTYWSTASSSRGRSAIGSASLARTSWAIVVASDATADSASPIVSRTAAMTNARMSAKISS